MKKNSKSHHDLSEWGNVYLSPKRTGEDMHRMAMDPEASPMRGHGLPKSACKGIGYPDSILTITTRKTSAFPKPSRVIKAGKKKE